MDNAVDQRVQIDAAAEILNRGSGKPAQALAVGAQNETDRDGVQMNIVSKPILQVQPLISEARRTISIGTIRPNNSADELWPRPKHGICHQFPV